MDAPKINAACSSLVPCADMVGINDFAISGKVTNKVTITMLGVANIKRIWCSASHAPQSPSNPNNSKNINPTTTGEMEKGRSSSAVNKLFP